MVEILMETVSAPGPRETELVERARDLNARAGMRARALRGLEGDPGAITTVMEFDTDANPAPPHPADSRVRRYHVVHEFLADSYEPTAITVLQGVLFDTDAGDDLAAWYAEEHMGLLFRVPGWLRCRRAELVSGEGPRYLALHELTRPEVATDPIGDAARSTPWRDRIMATITRSERELYEVLDAS